VTPSPQITIRPVKDLMEQNFIDYAVSVLTDRALPDVRDGLKPVHRRILHAMHEAGNTWNKGYKKSARMVGDVIGKYHPHGDSSVYGAAVRMAQTFSMRHVLIDGQGNFGSVDGDAPAAMRYTEMRLSRLAGEMFSDIDKETITWHPNYDGNESEPSVLTTPYPNLLVNGVEGIAVGMATSIPPHNLRAVVEATIGLIDNPNLSPHAIMGFLKAPDFPTGGLVYGLDGFADAIEHGRGGLRLRSKWHEEERGRGATSLVLDELPYQVNKARLVAKVADLVRSKEIDGIVGLRDESNKEGMRVVIELRSDVSAEVIFAQLAAKTDVETSVSYNCVVLDGGTPRTMGIKDMLRRWLTFREEVVLRRHVFERKQALAKLHILDGFMVAIGMMDQVIALIRGAVGPAEAKSGLMALLSIDDIQTQAILDLRLQKLTGLEIDAIKSEHQEYTDKVVALTTLIDSPEKIRGVIRDELEDIAKRYGEDRKTEIGHGIGDISREDLIEREDVLITMTRNGYIKRMPASALSAQGRGTRGRRLMDAGEDDDVTSIFQCNSHDQMMIFTESGQVYAGKAYKIPEGSVNAKGRHIRNVIEGMDEEIMAMLALPESAPDMSIITVTAEGQVKRTSLDDYANASRKGGIKGVAVDDDDTLIGVFACRPHDHMILTCNAGRAIRFDIEDVRVMGRTAGGVRGMKLDLGEKLVGAHVVHGNGQPLPKKMEQREIDGVMQPVEVEDTSVMDDGRFLVCIGEQGVGKRTPVSDFPVQSRAGKGVIALKVNKKTGFLVSALGATIDQDLILFASNGVTNRISVESVRETGRAASGVILMSLDKGETVISTTTALRKDEPQDGEE